MSKRHPVLVLLATIIVPSGCVWVDRRSESKAPDVIRTSHESGLSPTRPLPAATVASDPLRAMTTISGPVPVDDYIRHALLENRKVRAARFRVLEMKSRIPQAVALEDPMVQNTIWPFPSNGPQYSLMGYMPYEMMISQQFPWFGTLRLRGYVADQEARVAIADLATVQLDVVAAVKKAYYNLYAAERSIASLSENRSLATEFVELSRARVANGGSQQDLLRAEIAVTQLDQELAVARQFAGEARADLAEQLHMSPETDLQTLPEISLTNAPVEIDRLYRLAIAARPELQSSLAAITKDQHEIELARKRYYPQFNAGVAYALMTRQDNPSAKADGHDNVGFTIGFNLPIYRKKLDAAVCEAKARAASDALKYEAERDRTYREVKESLVQARAQREMIDLLEAGILPKSEEALKLAAVGYRNNTLDYLTLNTARQEWLQLQLQLVRLKAELAKALTALERAVGVELNEHPIGPAASPRAAAPALPPPPTTPGPFGLIEPKR
jgi:outer membrane protein, heavy metal efflux system